MTFLKTEELTMYSVKKEHRFDITSASFLISVKMTFTGWAGVATCLLLLLISLLEEKTAFK